MKRASVWIPWSEGLHLRPASALVRLAQQFESAIRLQCNGRIADARSIVSILLLCAAANAPVEIEAVGEDEEIAIHAVKGLFSDPPSNLPSVDPPSN